MLRRALALFAVASIASTAHALPDRWKWLPGQEPPKIAPTIAPALPRSLADRPDDVRGPQIHLMYVLPSDGADEQLDTNGKIGTSALAFNRWLFQQTPGRQFRIDTYNGVPDITFFRLSRTDAQVRAMGAFVRDEIEAELSAAGMIRSDKLYAVYYGGSSSVACGGGAYPPTLPGRVGAMYLKGEPPGAPACATNVLGGGIEAPGYLEYAMIHELMHTQGFVAACAPHQWRAGHVSDSPNDLMWAGDAPWEFPPRLDIGHDDYYRAGIPGCLDLDTSPYLIAENYQGLWWRSPASSEAGWGMNIAHQGDTLFVTWFTYDTDGSGMWLVATAPKVATSTYSGPLLRTTGPPFSGAWDASRVVATPVGSATFQFLDAGNGDFTYTVNGVNQFKEITREIFGSPLANCAPATSSSTSTNFTDLWWRSPANSESGWGINFTHQGDTIFGSWFTYDTNGKGMWLVVTAPHVTTTSASVYTGTLYRTTGPPFNAVPWTPTQVVATAVGSATITFNDFNTGTFAYTVNGTTQSKPITREVFATPASTCN